MPPLERLATARCPCWGYDDQRQPADLAQAVAFVAFLAASIAIAYGVYAVLIWLFRDNVAAGWLTTQVVAVYPRFSFLVLRSLRSPWAGKGHRRAVKRGSIAFNC